MRTFAALGSCVLLASTAVLARGATEGGDPPSSAGTELVEGVDVSHYQGEIDWGKVEGAGISFAYIKATQGAKWSLPAHHPVLGTSHQP